MVDLVRRLSLTCFLLLLERWTQLLVALTICTFFAIMHRGIGGYYDAATDVLALACSYEITVCVLGLVWVRLIQLILKILFKNHLKFN